MKNQLLPSLVIMVLAMAPNGFAAPVESKSTERIDPAAWRVVQHAAAAYAKLKTYTGTMEIHTIAPPGINWGESPQRAVLAYKSPNKCSVVIQNGDGLSTSISDGHDVYSTVPHSGRFLKTAAPTKERLWTGQFGIDDVLMTFGTGYFANLTTVNSDNSLRSVIIDDPHRPEEILQTIVTLDATASVNGEPVNTVVVSTRHFSRQIGEAQAKWRTGLKRFSFAKSDGLLRRVSMEYEHLPGEKPIVTIETHTVTSLNAPLPEAMFRFAAPSDGAQAVSSSRQLQPETPPNFDAGIKVGAEPFAFHAADLSGQPLSLDGFKGRVLLLDFWATWCGPCLGEIPETRVVYDKYHAQGFDVIGVSLDEKRTDLTEFLKKEKLSWPQIFDGKAWKSPIVQQYGVTGIPAAFLIGRDGKIAAVDVRGPALEPAVQQALSQKMPLAAP